MSYLENGATLAGIRAEGDCPMAYPSLEGSECPYPFYTWARDKHPVYQLPGTTFYFLSRHADVDHVMMNPELFSSVGRTLGTRPEPRPRTASGIEIRPLMESDDPDHRRHRQFLFQLLNPAAMARYRPFIAEICDTLIDRFIEAGECEFVAAFSAPLPALVTARVAGFPDSVIEDLGRWGRIEASGAPFLPPERFAEHVACRNAMVEYVQKALEERLETPREDGLSQLLRSQIERDGELCMPYIALQAMVLLAGGVSTTAHMVAMAMQQLLQHPEQLHKVKADRSLIPAFIEEALRLETPVQWLPRRVVEDVEIAGVRIPAGSHVIMGLAAANRDGREYAEPDTFNVERKGGNRHLGFGRGMHNCIGQALARTEMTIAFDKLFTRLNNLRLAPDNDFRHLESASFRGLERLHIFFDPGKRLADG
jgi:cytochrome P450